MQRIVPFLWFDGQAEEAMQFYTSVFRNSRIVSITRYGKEGPGPEGSVMTVIAELEGQKFYALNGGPQFSFTPAISFFVYCETQEEIDELWSKLTEGGEEVACGWLKDKYGVSWQIVPTVIEKMLHDPDPERFGRFMRAMMQMVKLDIETLKRAYEGE